MLESIEKMKGKIPDAMYQQMEAQARQVAAEMAAHPDRPPIEVLKKVTGIDFEKLARRAEEIRKQNPGMSQEEVSRRVASEMVLELPKPAEPAPASKP